MANQFFLPYRPAYDNAGGLVVPGAQVYFTNVAGTAKPIYSNSGLTLARSNPVIADGVGKLPTGIYMDPAITYRVRIYARGATVGVDTPIQDFNPYVPGVFADATALQPVADAAAASAVAASDSATAAAASASSAGSSATSATNTLNALIAAAAGASIGVVEMPTYSPMLYGATGVGSETLSATSYATDAGGIITITQQTLDGKGINAAIVAARTAYNATGISGEIVLPAGIFTTYGYLEPLNFPVKIRGAGKGLTIIRNCVASPWSNGYGIFVVEPSVLGNVEISDMTLDGRGPSRTLVAAEVRAYPIAVYGIPKLTLRNLEVINSPIDCMTTAYTNGEVGAYLEASDCLFSNAYRNTVSCVTGWNQQFTNCIIEKGGFVQGGANPRACLDVEPNASGSAYTIKNVVFTNCTFRDAINSLMYGTWAGNVRFDGCTFKATGGTGATGTGGAMLPYLVYARAGQFYFSDCTFEGDGSYKSAIVCANDVTTGDYATSQFVRFDNCSGEGCGFLAYGPYMKLNDCEFRNSFKPFLVSGANSQNIEIDGLRLINVFDPTTLNAGTGAKSSFATTNQFIGAKSWINDMRVIVDTNVMPTGFAAALAAATTQQYGIYLDGSAGKIRISNVHAGGYYRQLPTALGQSLNASDYRDWGLPNTVPADTAGQTTNASTLFYRGCTMYGDAA